MMRDPALIGSRPRAAEDGLSDLLMWRAAAVTSERVALGDMAEFLGDRSIAGLLPVLALPMVLPVPAPGISVLFGMPLIVISGSWAWNTFDTTTCLLRCGLTHWLMIVS
jgi:hypothetical protein